MKNLKLHPWIIVSTILIMAVSALGVVATNRPAPALYQGSKTFWDYQCIDTMKASRDKARDWAKRPDLRSLVDNEMGLVARTGANCVAIDTPYDPEFTPVLRTWVASARSHHLRIWFRGNFSSWEGWFDYPKGMTTNQLFDSTRGFIFANSSLFETGDIFTAAPEAENGGPFNQVEPDEYPAYRAFLIAEAHQSAADFAAVKKQVKVNWASMNGGLAKRMLDKPTIDALGGVVTIDHYIKNPAEMSAYIDYFASNFGAKVVIGEWGAPIPEINGSFTPTQQADFVNQLLATMAAHAGDIESVNYWTLTDGSTRLIDDSLTKQPAYDVLTRYYSPGVLKGTIRNQAGKPLQGVTVSVNDALTATTDSHGNYSLLAPSGPDRLSTKLDNYTDATSAIDLPSGRETTLNLTLERNDL